MNSSIFVPQSTSTPKKTRGTVDSRQLCSTPRPDHLRWSLAKHALRPVDSSTPITKKSRKSLAPNLHDLLYPSLATEQQAMKIWLL